MQPPDHRSVYGRHGRAQSLSRESSPRDNNGLEAEQRRRRRQGDDRMTQETSQDHAGHRRRDRQSRERERHRQSHRHARDRSRDSPDREDRKARHRHRHRHRRRRSRSSSRDSSPDSVHHDKLSNSLRRNEKHNSSSHRTKSPNPDSLASRERRRRRRRSRSPADSNPPSHSAAHSPSRRRRRHHSPSTSPDRQRPSQPSPQRHRRRRRSPSSPRAPPLRAAAPLPSQNEAFSRDLSGANGQSGNETSGQGPPVKQVPNYGTTGALATEANTVAGTRIVLKYHEPAEARKPPATQDWRLYEFKGGATLATVALGERSCWLFGRERVVADFLVEHPSCSKQHAVLQFRWIERRDEWGARSGSVRPYVLDLDSANGTSLNGDRIPASRYLELKSGDMLKFGDSTREYVVMLAPAE